ncbi:MAG: branched-chain amino acid ABC transporter permease [Burkholderiaceae bacterium]|nr:branched-chain amino acid ABC transporter permease [Burkholderiaceae bacterium]
MTLVVQILIDSILLGGLLALGALGFSLVWGVLNVLNLMYASFIVAGGFLSYWLWSIGVDFLLTVPLTMLALFAIGWAIQRFVIDWVIGGPHTLSIALTYGLNLAIIGAMLYFFSAEDRSIQVPEYLRGYFEIAGAKLPHARALVAVIAVLLTFAAWWVFDRTETGATIRATRLDQEAARLVGIDVRKVFDLTTALAAALAGAMGALVAQAHGIAVGSGDHLLLQILIVTVLGGLGSVIGPIAGAAVVALATSISAALFGSTYSILVGTILVLIILTVRPSGLFGRRFYDA